LIDQQRRGLVDFHAENWSKHFSLTIAMASGAPARLAALNAALRQYRPFVLHMPNVKAFWFHGDLWASLEAIHHLDFDAVEGTPSISVEDLDDEVGNCLCCLRTSIIFVCRCADTVSGRRDEASRG
jgi:hypothetical protein